MNILVQCAGVVLLLVLLLFSGGKKTLPLNTRRAFINLFGITLSCVLLDITSIIVIVNMDILSMWFVNLICKLYLVMLVLVSFCNVLYVYNAIYKQIWRYKEMAARVAVLAVAFCIGIFVTPIYVYCDMQENIVYSYGPSTLVTYAGAVTMILINVGILVSQRKFINPRIKKTVSVWLMIWVVSALIQYFNSSILLVGFASAIGILVMYLQFENPELNLDRNSGLFNALAFEQFIQQKYDQEENFSLLVLIMEQHRIRNVNAEKEKEVLAELLRRVSRLKDTYAFKVADSEIFLLFDGRIGPEEGLSRVQDTLQDVFKDVQNLMLKPNMIFMRNPRLVAGKRELQEFVDYTKLKNKKYLTEHFLDVEWEDVEALYREHEMELYIRDAIEQGRIEVFYQPIYSIAQHRFTSAEALVRIMDENGKILSPDTFIPFAESNGMILEIGELVFEQVCSFFKKAGLQQYGIEYIEVNLSVIQCVQENLADRFIEIMERYELPPNYINLEITESASLNEKHTLLKNMRNLINYGVHFSLDDFGTGQSNLNYIVDMPVHIVKFDKDMTSAYFENKKAKYVMDVAIHMIHGMELEIVSEGIETKEQYDEMERLGINYIQGYYFSKPLPEDCFIEFMKKN